MIFRRGWKCWRVAGHDAPAVAPSSGLVLMVIQLLLWTCKSRCGPFRTACFFSITSMSLEFATCADLLTYLEDIFDAFYFHVLYMKPVLIHMMIWVTETRPNRLRTTQLITSSREVISSVLIQAVVDDSGWMFIHREWKSARGGNLQPLVDQSVEEPHIVQKPNLLASLYIGVLLRGAVHSFSGISSTREISNANECDITDDIVRVTLRTQTGRINAGSKRWVRCKSRMRRFYDCTVLEAALTDSEIQDLNYWTKLFTCKAVVNSCLNICAWIAQCKFKYTICQSQVQLRSKHG